MRIISGERPEGGKRDFGDYWWTAWPDGSILYTKECPDAEKYNKAVVVPVGHVEGAKDYYSARESIPDEAIVTQAPGGLFGLDVELRWTWYEVTL